MTTECVKFMSAAHLNNMNVALYVHHDYTATLYAENVTNSKSVGGRRFKSIADAEAWYQVLPGHGLGKLKNALERLDYRYSHRIGE